jgi:hypothetical protein
MVTALNSRSSSEQNRTARERLLQVVHSCSNDRYAFFPPLARESIAPSGTRDLVVMGAQKSSFGYHLDLIEHVVATNPGLRLRAIVDENPKAIAHLPRGGAEAAELLSVSDFFARRADFAGCMVVDRYCTWLPGIKYKSKLKAAGFDVLRFEQFLNAPGLACPYPHFRGHSDFMLANFDRFLALESLWADDKSRFVYYTCLAGFISLDFTWFAFGCDDHEERYMPSDALCKHD